MSSERNEVSCCKSQILTKLICLRGKLQLFDANYFLFTGLTEPFDSNRLKSKGLFKNGICRKFLLFYWGSRFICRKYGLSQGFAF